MPKLLQINVSCNHGSTGIIAEQIGIMLQEKGWEVYLAHGARYVNKSRLNTYKVQNIKSEYLHAIKSLLFDADGLGSSRSTKQLVEYIKSIKPDLIQIHNLHGYYINYKILFDYLNKTNIPIVMTLHDCWLFTGHCTHFITAKCYKWINGCEKCPQTHSVPKSLFLDRSRRNYKLKKEYIAKNKNIHMVCVSKWMEKLVHKSIYKDNPIHLIYNGIDTRIFYPMHNKRGNVFRILGVSSPWTKEKGLYDFYKLREILPLDKYNITLIGLTKKQKKQLPIGINGLLRTNNQRELSEIYSNSDVFVNLTYADTFPTTNIESLSCGTPIITYDTGGSPEATSNKTGVVIEKGDVEGLAKEIKRMKEFPLSSIECRKRAMCFFNKEDRHLEYFNLYNKLITKKKIESY